MNGEVMQVIERTLKMEAEYYGSDVCDKLKTAPYVMVKRLERETGDMDDE